MAEKMIDKVVRLSKDPKHIRNICTCAHIDHGKCVGPETRIQLVNGGVMKANQLFKLAVDKGIKSYEDATKIIYDINELNIQTFSYNKQKGKLENKRIDHAWKLKGGKTIKAELRNGFNIETTPEHKYLIFENLEIIEKPANELKIGDKLVCARNIETKNEQVLEEQMLLGLTKGNFYATLEENFGKEIKNKILEKGIKELTKIIDCSVKLKSFYHGIWQNRYLLKDIVAIAKLFSIDLKELYYQIENITYRSGKHRGKSSLPVKLPSNFEDFFYLTGLFFGDGSGNKFVVRKESLGKKFKLICESLGVKVGTRNYKNKTLELTSNATILYILHYLFDYPIKQKSHNIKLNNFVFTATKSCKAKFVSAYFDCDGTVEKSRRAISLTSVSKQMLKDLQLLLLQLGCISQVQKDTLYITGLTMKIFSENIGFGLVEKQKKAEFLSEKATGSYIFDVTLTNKEAGKTLMLPQINGQLQLQAQQQNINLNQLAFIEITSLSESYQEVVYDFSVPDNKNFLAEGIIIHNTTFSDNLLFGAGMMSEHLAGHARVLDIYEDEKARGITIDSVAVSMVHDFEGTEHLINLIDTPGHVDFGGDVTRAMRAIDGAIVLVCAVEGIMPQTETVLRQALKERVKPVLFINKVDRLIKELQLTPESMQERFLNSIAEVNRLIREIAPGEYGEKWQVNVQDGSVAFGSAFHNWALSLPYMKKKGITFKDIIDAYQGANEEYKTLAKKAPIHEVILDMSIKHHPSPDEAQKYRIPRLWKGDLESEQGKDLLTCNPTGKLMICITKVVVDPQAGEISCGRIFSGTAIKGTEVYLNQLKQPSRIQQVFMFNGAKRDIVESIPAGNVLGLAGIKAYPGETVSLEPTEPFEQITHIFEPVITKAIEATKPSDLPRLVEVLRQVTKEDPSIKIEINEETGENLMHGMGELHLEIIENRIKTNKGLQVKTSAPIVVYREAITKESPEVEGKTPNKHNKMYFSVKPVDAETYGKIKSGEIPEGRIKKKDLAIRDSLVECGWDNKEALKLKDIYKGCLFVDGTRGIVQINEIMEMLLDMFEQVIDQGPIAREPCIKIQVTLHDAKLHEDAIHRGPAQMYPAIRQGIGDAMMQAGPVIFEPLQVLQIEAPNEFMGEVSKLISNKRGQLLEMNQEGSLTIFKAKLPVAELIGWSSALRSATGGRGNSSLIDQLYEKLPGELQDKVVKQIRTRKGLADTQ